MMTVIKDYIYSKKYRHVLRAIRIVVYEKSMLEDFKKMAKAVLSPEPSILSTLSSTLKCEYNLRWNWKLEFSVDGKMKKIHYIIVWKQNKKIYFVYKVASPADSCFEKKFNAFLFLLPCNKWYSIELLFQFMYLPVY